MKRLLIGLGAVALIIGLGFILLTRGDKAAHRDGAVAPQLPRQLVAGSGSGREETGLKRSPEEAKPSDKATAQPATKGPSQRKFELADEELARRPELKAALNNNLRRVFLEGSGDLEKLLGIDRASARRLVDLLSEQALVQNDAADVMRERGIRSNDPQYDTILRDFRHEMDAEIRAIVGEEKFELLKLAPMVQQSQIDLAKNYAAQFREIDAPLSPDQSLQLAILMARFDVRDESAESMQTAAGPGQYLRPRSDVPMLEAASKILTPAQLDVMRRRLAEQNMERDFQRELKEEIFPANGLK